MAYMKGSSASELLCHNLNKMANELDTLVTDNKSHTTTNETFYDSTDAQEHNATGSSMARVNTYLQQTVTELPVPGSPQLTALPVLMLRPDNMHFVSSAAEIKPALLGAMMEQQQQQPPHNCGQMYCGLGANYVKYVQKENVDHTSNLVFRVFKELFNLHEILNMCLPPELASTLRNELPLTANSVTLGNGNLNLQYHVRQAVRKCTMGRREMERIISDYKVFNVRKYADCDRLLKVMGKLIGQLDLYRDIVLEHRRMMFVLEEAKALAIRLELLLQQLNEQIKNCYYSVQLLTEYVRNLKYRGLLPANAGPFSGDGYARHTNNTTDERNSNNNNSYANNGDDRNNRLNGAQQAAANAPLRKQRQPLRFIG